MTRVEMVCVYPKRLAFGSIDSLIGKFRVIFAENGRGSEWHSMLDVVNPAACRLVKAYLTYVREEPFGARITPRQVEPIILGNLAVISNYIENMLLNS